MKKKILSLLLTFSLFVISLFSFSGCDLVQKDTVAINKKTSMVVGDTTLSKSDIINTFYSYYQNNSSNFAYYSNDVIEESFYSYAVIKEIIKQKAYADLYDAKNNPNGKLIFTKEDNEEVLKSTYKYIYSQVLSYEKAIYELDKNFEEDDYPIWLKDDEEEEEDTYFEEYISKKPVIEKKSTSDADEKYSESVVKNKLSELEQYLKEYTVSTDDDGNETRQEIDETKYIKGARKDARAQYIGGLASNAKANGLSTDTNTLLENELYRVYEAYYDTKVQTLFQEYYLNDYLTDTVNGDTESLSDKTIARAFLEQYYKDFQTYKIEGNYVSTMTSSDGASLVLYNYNGRNYFFTVQHILVKYDDYMTETVGKIYGAPDSSSDHYDVISSSYKTEREALTKEYSMLTEINEKAKEKFGNCLDIVGSYYYYDEEYKGNKDYNYGYLKLKTTTNEDKTIYSVDTSLYAGLEEREIDEADVKFMASATEVIDCYKTNVTKWENIFNEYKNASAEEKKILRGETEEDGKTSYKETAYIFDVIDNMLENNNDPAEIKSKIASLLFVELQWVYSSDSLGNEFANKAGYVVSNYDDENGSWVADFAIGAREIMKNVKYTGNNSEITASLNMVISDYGYHIIKIENVYESGKSIVDFSKLTKSIDLDDPESVAEIIDLIKHTYVSTSSNQTIYDYFYDSLYDTLIGTSSTSGTYYTALQYKWYHEYTSTGKVEIKDKLTYDELMDAIS